MPEPKNRVTHEDLQHPNVQALLKQIEEAIPEEVARIKALSPEEVDREIKENLKSPNVQKLLQQIRAIMKS